MDYYKLSVHLEEEEMEMSDILAYELGELGFESFDETDGFFNAYIPAHTINKKEIENLFDRYKNQLKASYKLTSIPAQNWNAAWESAYEPVEIETILRIRAEFHQPLPDFVHEIIINPKMSFGTGHHETTRLVAKKMSTLDLKNKSVLDMGCGTGILAIYAEKLGANKIHAIDIEDSAYENTLENVELNQCRFIRVDKGGAEKIPSQRFNLILANINRNILLQQIPVYAKHLDKGAILVLSGFFDSDCPTLVSACEKEGMKFVSKDLLHNWACLHLEIN